MFQLTVQHPRDDFHILMRVRAKAGTGLHRIGVAHQEQPMMSIGRIIMVRKTEAVPRVEPVDLGVKTLLSSTDIDFGGLYPDPAHGSSSSRESSASSLAYLSTFSAMSRSTDHFPAPVINSARPMPITKR